jgi:hypothetical protein
MYWKYWEHRSHSGWGSLNNALSLEYFGVTCHDAAGQCSVRSRLRTGTLPQRTLKLYLLRRMNYNVHRHLQLGTPYMHHLQFIDSHFQAKNDIQKSDKFSRTQKSIGVGQRETNEHIKSDLNMKEKTSLSIYTLSTTNRSFRLYKW